jgi:50S ribosomal subunit-associated GTPase HflX
VLEFLYKSAQNLKQLYNIGKHVMSPSQENQDKLAQVIIEKIIKNEQLFIRIQGSRYRSSLTKIKPVLANLKHLLSSLWRIERPGMPGPS